MNFSTLESKFKNIEKRQHALNSYFNPLTKGGPKHYCIKDLFQDFQYDTRLYGLGKFLKVSSDPPTKPFKKSSQPVINKNPISDPQTNRIEKYHRLIKSTDLEALSIKEVIPKVKIIKKYKERASSNLSKLKDLSLLEKCKLTPKDEYFGLFSNTKISTITEGHKNSKSNKMSNEWITSYKPSRQNSKSSFDMFKSDNDYKQNPNIQLVKKAVKEKSQIHPKEYSVEKYYKEKPIERFKLDKGKYKKSAKIQPQKLKWFEIKYQNSPYWKPMVQGIIELTLINNDKYPNTCFNVQENQVVNIMDISWLEHWQNTTFRVQVKNNDYFEYYLHFGEENDHKQKQVEEIIESFLVNCKPERKKNASVSPVNPLALKKISEKSPMRSKSTIKLPLIAEKTAEVFEGNYDNPITQRLVKYRESMTRFYPASFQANLTIFEMHDMIENRYSKNKKEAVEIVDEEVKFELKGNKLIND
ncbi:hypothetical protein SteCoe_27610 [Stentor coeruleus]|uniref:Uncharacterized protein n=1 Tax=Stentor coeruleus TaxID=5963 RepID=A0A1R2BA59_9CILI|nr:hypothetical protein SteCoe_27610 [Stentor coeruleus]